MHDPGETFRTICELRQLSPDALEDATIVSLARLALDETDYAVPVFAAFKHLALPIAAEWILSNASTVRKSNVFCRLAYLCPLWPPLQPLTEHFFDMNREQGKYVRLTDADDMDGILLSISRLLLHDFGRFSGFFSAESLRELAAAQTSKKTRALALYALALLTQVSESVLEKWLLEYVGSDSTELQFSVVLTAARQMADDVKVFASQELLPASIDHESPLVANVENIFVPRFGQGAPKPLSWIRTPTAQANLRNIAINLLKDKPLLLSGEAGSGKTFFAEVLHSKVRPGGDIVRIHLGDQTDAKALVGSYTTGSKPGTFEWSPGALTTAVTAGKWVLVEDIDRAPTEIVAVLLPLVDRRELVIPSRNQVVKAAPGFQLIATTTSSQFDLIGGRGWAHSDVEAPSVSDLLAIINGERPFLAANVVSMLLDTFRRVQEFQEKNTLVRRATTRDLFKLVARITPRYDSDDIFREIVACFASHLAEPRPLATVVADALGYPASKVEPLLLRHKPVVSVTAEELAVGRAMIERRPVSGSAARNADSQAQESKFALTGPTLRLLEEVAVAVAHSEPVLLVGETGTGKTSAVQYLAQLARRKLVVINVSQQVEAGDLIGGFRPVDARQLAGPILDEFNELFDSTFSRAKNHQFIEVLERTVGRQHWSHVVKLLREAVKMAIPQRRGGEAKRPKVSGEWAQFAAQVDFFDKRVKEVEHHAQFQFIEGLLVRAMRQGHWVLLDEFNLAPADTLEGIGELVSSRTLTLLEQGGEVVNAADSFRLFANMNPATDVGKRDLPQGIRAQFTELWAPSPDSDSDALRTIVTSYLPQGTQPSVINDVSELFVDAKHLAETHQLVDGAGQRPHFSVRTLSRALVCAVAISSRFGLRRALFEAFSMCFLTLLDEQSAEKLSKAIDSRLLAKLPNRNSVLSQIPVQPQDGLRYEQFKHWWMPLGNGVPQDDPGYIITPSVERNLLNLVRATATKMFPVLIQGPTSSGKTSMITHLAKRTGHNVVRINNHEHTDLAEYLGGYESDSDGKLVFKEGALVMALRRGDWLVLDELNLAPTDVLEALNRLLDDNRELLVPETQEIIKPHPDFILFATQNPPGLYAGRKVLSRAFRNRFLELHFGDIPESELEVILRDRSRIAPSYATKIVEVYRELGRRRSGSRVFEHPATLRDLFRWASRPAIGYEELAQNGFALLGERSRSYDERQLVKSVISDVMRVSIDIDYADLAAEDVMNSAPSSIVWTRAMRRVLTLVSLALDHNEPVLLVGETGCGKTTIVQALAAAKHQRLTTLNAHQNTETGDLVGSQRPARHGTSRKLFEWVDGPLVTSLKEGNFFLLDEISLADDSVLERLNSILEAERTLFVPEIGSFQAAEGFQFLATMNPGGDYGKKELSPALRNRFTEIWVPSVDSEVDLRMIVGSRLTSNDDMLREKAVSTIVSFSQYFSKHFGLVSLRDVLSWAQFVEELGVTDKSLVHGASMVFVDGLGSNAYAHLASSPETLGKAKAQCLKELEKLVESKVDITDAAVELTQSKISIGGFAISRQSNSQTPEFSFSAPTTALNAMRVVRALQLRKPVLLEGSPGAGKTSLIAALAQLSGHKLTRINLSDQTDLADLFGSDIPLDKPGHFGWRDAPFLRAMQRGEWVLLDEMNLAPQQVLEGLNACLDHRGEAYLPELDRTFTKHPDFVVFAAQNPHAQGGGRKGLPKSFVNRFSVVYVEQLGLNDLHAISAACYPGIDVSIREPLVSFVEELAQWAVKNHVMGGPFEFNLRDTMRWLDLVSQTGEHPSRFLGLVVTQRFRTPTDREAVEKMFKRYFSDKMSNELNPVMLTPECVSFGAAEANRTGRTFARKQLGILSSQIDVLETATYCIEKRWPMILVGPSGSGKTSVIRLLAQLCGARLHEFAITADIDSTDLLGEFDQVEKQSQLERLWAEFDETVEISQVSDSNLVDAVRSRDLEAAVSLIDRDSPLVNLVRDFQARDYTRPAFQWFDGMLVRAVERGHWLVLDNANLCSPAVLDRLNSLLERGGTLFVNECAEPDGSPRQVEPHPDFRLFLTVDPRYGELSRAMRNRGTEIWLSRESVSEYDNLVSEQRVVSGALPVTAFSKPYNASKFGDLRTQSNLRALLLDPMTGQHISEIDHELGKFAQQFNVKLCPRGGFIGGVEALQRDWSLFHARAFLEKASLADEPSNLVELSALYRRKDSVECDFDIFGVASLVCELLEEQPLSELASVLYDFLEVKDPSRVPVFRDWLVSYGEQHGLTNLVDAVVRLLGVAYDYSSGGSGMDQLWQAYARDLGFNDAALHDKFVYGKSLASKFDELVAPLSIEHAGAVSEIRLALIQALGADSEALDELSGALNDFKESLDASKSSLRPPNRILTEQFKELFAGFGLANVVCPSQMLSKALTRLAYFASTSTESVYEITSAVSLNAPAITVLPFLEDVVLSGLRLDVQGSARSELNELSRILVEQSGTLVKIMKPLQLVSDLVMRNARLVAEAVPEAAEDMAKVMELARVDATSACATLASLLLDLYVCPLPMDPAIAQHVWYERYLRLQSVHTQDNVAWSEIRSVFGSKESDIDSWLQNRELAHVPVPTVYRPSTSAISFIHRDMVAAAQLARSALGKNQTPEERDVVIRNAAHLQDRLSRATGYRDLVAPVRTALALLTLSMSAPPQSPLPGNLWLLDPITVGHSVPDIVPDYPLLVLQSIACSDEPPLDSLRDILDDLYRRWTLERLRMDEQRREEAAGFRYDDDDGLAAEREFHAMFPDYEGEVQLPEQADDFAPRLVSVYKNIFSDSKQNAMDVCVAAAAELQIATGHSSDRHLPALYLALKQRLENPQTQSSEINFYTDSSASESALGAGFATKVCARARQLMQMWPEHDALLTLVRVGDEVCNLPPAVPVALHLAKTEQLHHWLYEWDRFAAKDAKVGDLLSAAAALIVRWRRLELATWPALFAVERKRCSDSNAPFWYHLYETLIFAPTEDVQETAKVLTIFMSEATVGQYEDRLDLLVAFQKHNSILKREKLANCIANIGEFYRLFLPSIKQHLASGEKLLRKQVDDVVKLASWRDVNIHALKQSAQRSHRQLFKTVKKYRSLLAETARTEYPSQPGLTPITLVQGDWPEQWNPEWLTPLKEDLHTGPTRWSSRPRPFQDIDATARLLQSYIKAVARTETADLSEFAGSIEKRAAELRDETPKVASKDTKKAIASLRVQKQQLLTATLRELRSAGLRTAVRKDTIASQMELTKVLATTPSLSASNRYFAASEPSFFALVELLPRLRAAVSEAANNPQIDVPITDLQRGLAFTENSFALVLKLRRAAGKHTAVKDSNCYRKTLTDICMSGEAVISECESASRAATKVDALTNTMNALLQRLYTASGDIAPAEAGNLLSVVAHKPLCDVKLMSASLSNWLDEVTAGVESIQSCFSKAEFGVGPLMSGLIDEFRAEITQARVSIKPLDKLETVEEVDTAVTTASNTVLVVVQHLVKVVSSSEPEGTQSGSGEQMNDDDDDDDDDNWLIRSLSLVEKMLSSLQPSKVIPRFQAATELIFRLSMSDSRLATAYSALLVAFVRGYDDLVRVVQTIYARSMSQTSFGVLKLASLLLSLANDGFCSPHSVDDDNEEEQQSEGTGLGDGSGGQSSSKDVDEEDDDVSEAMQTANPEQRERDEADDGEDNAKEVEGDMAGQTEDLPPQSDDEDDDNRSDDEQDPEDETGDLDDLDPNAVDEKMWDEDRKDAEEKEKHTEESVQGSKDEEAEARENEEQKDSSNQNAQDDDPEGEEDGSEDVEEQDEDVKQGDHDELQDSTEQKDALELPEDMDLENQSADSDNGEGNDAEESEEEVDADFKDPMDEGQESPLSPDNQNAEEEPHLDDATNEDELEDEIEAAGEKGDDDDGQPDEDVDMQDDADDQPDEKGENAEDSALKDPEEMDVDEAEQGMPEGEGAGADVEGLDGPNTEQSQEQQQAAAKEDRTETKGQGTCEDATTEEAHLGTGGSAGANAEDVNQENNGSQEKDETTESLKTLSDAVKEFHRRQRSIRERQQNDPGEEEQGKTDDPNRPLEGHEELEHVGADDAFDTQALGRSDEKEKQSIDETLGIDDEEDPQLKDVAGDEEQGAEQGAQQGGEPDAFLSDEESSNVDELSAVANANANDHDEEEDDDVEDKEVHRDASVEEESTASDTTELWQTYEGKTHELALVLGEQLRLILEPTVASKLRGDYRTGKRLNMKRIIPYIASEFRKDKIWLRRTKPAKRQFQVLLALDDSKSMGEPAVVDLAFQAIALVGTALSNIEAGQMGIAKFGGTTEFVHELDKPFTPQAGNAVLRQFGFAQHRTDVRELVERSLEMFEEHQSGGEQWRLEIIVSDGITDDHAHLRRLVRKARDERVMLVFVVLDALNRETSILDMKEVRYTTDENGNQKLEVSKYMEDFPFEYYVIVRNIDDLPMVLASVLRQYFQAVEE